MPHRSTRALRGGLDDPAFPTPARAGPEAGLLLDVVVHLSIGFGAMVLTDKITQQAVLHQDWNDQRVHRWTIVRVFLLASFVDRVLL
ncbi:hypothetical protein ATM97_24735 [Nocardia sp. MH4]|uniref:hypothetical protein n=1 Tax=Nocardia sp. MH4 TaxID=1768677 RepID=UPI001C4F55E1|nr:hypothetical protein [Nocardia sp. MH4]MBW0273294.1 hypothetical protein [Nocardia sp. MH4]